MAKVSTRLLADFESPEVPRKIARRSKSPRQKRPMLPNFQIYEIIFEYGPPQLNLMRYVAKKTIILWKEAKEKCILNDDGKPSDGFLFISGNDGNAENCLRMFGFDVYQNEKLSGTECALRNNRESVCLFYFGEQFWKTLDIARVEKIRNIMRGTSNANIFFMTVSDNERDEAIKCCTKYKLCVCSHVISPATDKKVFYEAFYKVLDKNLQTFSSDLETRTSTRQIHAIKCKLNSFIEKLRSRNAPRKSPLTNRCLEIIKTPRQKRPMLPNFQIYEIIFEYGPPQLNLMRYVAKKTIILWKEAKEKCILNDDGKPSDGFLFISGNDGNAENCLRMFGFDVYQNEKLSGTECALRNNRESVCLFYFGEQFWKTLDIARVEKIRNIMRGTSNANIFFMTVSDNERDEAIKCCTKYKLCVCSHVISPATDKKVFYEAFYKVLDKNLQTFSSDLETRTSTRQIHAIKCKLNSFIEKLRSRNAPRKSPLTNRCLEIIKTSSENGIVGYRLFGNELHIYGNERLTTEKRIEIENSIKKNFNGQVHFRPLSNVLKPQCTVRCGDYLRNDALGIKGTIGMFGEMKDTLKNDSIHTVALSSPHVISSGDVACSSTGERIGECIWPGSKANIHDVSIIKIDSSVINSLQRTYFNKKIEIGSIPKEYLLYRDVFKYGATTRETTGSIEQIDNFKLFDRDVMAISSDDPESPFSTNGDSGAIVLTILDQTHHGIGVIYGGSLDDRGANSSITEKESIAIFLKKAIDRFSTEANMTIEFDKI